MPLKPRFTTAQNRHWCLALKAGIRSLHEGAFAIPRKVVIEALSIHNSTYSRWLDDAQPDLPSVTDLMVIVTVARNPAPIQAIASQCGDGYLVVEDHGQAEEAGSAKGMRVQSLEADSAVDMELARDLEDGRLDPVEAQRLIAKLEARGEVNRRHLELAKRVVATGLAAGGLQ